MILTKRQIQLIRMIISGVSYCGKDIDDIYDIFTEINDDRVEFYSLIPVVSDDKESIYLGELQG